MLQFLPSQGSPNPSSSAANASNDGSGAGGTRQQNSPVLIASFLAWKAAKTTRTAKSGWEIRSLVPPSLLVSYSEAEEEHPPNDGSHSGQKRAVCVELQGSFFFGYVYVFWKSAISWTFQPYRQDDLKWYVSSKYWLWVLLEKTQLFRNGIQMESDVGKRFVLNIKMEKCMMCYIFGYILVGRSHS